MYHVKMICCKGYVESRSKDILEHIQVMYLVKMIYVVKLTSNQEVNTHIRTHIQVTGRGLWCLTRYQLNRIEHFIFLLDT